MGQNVAARSQLALDAVRQKEYKGAFESPQNSTTTTHRSHVYYELATWVPGAELSLVAILWFIYKVATQVYDRGLKIRNKEKNRIIFQKGV